MGSNGINGIMVSLIGGDQNHWTGEAEEMAQVLQQGKLRHGKLQGGAPLTIAL